MFCRNCGHEVNEGDKICYNCGADLDSNKPQNNINTNNTININAAAQDQGSIGWAILGFFIPLAGLILFCVWNKDKPKSAKQAGIGALVSVILEVLGFVAYFVCIFALAAGSIQQAVSCFIGL